MNGKAPAPIALANLGSTAAASVMYLDIAGKPRRLELQAVGGKGEWRVTLDGSDPIACSAQLLQPGILSLIIGGRSYRCVLDEGVDETAIQVRGERFVYRLEDPRSFTGRRRKAGSVGGAQSIKAPMPGRIVRLLVAPGDRVEAHQGVVAIEAMKMQNELTSQQAGIVAEIRCKEGATVGAGQVLVVIS